jgi:hypothetical protein
MIATLNEEPILTMSLWLPMNGAWSAELSVGTDSALATGDSVTLNVLGLSLTGRVIRASIVAERLAVRLTGGSINWGQSVDAKHYKNVLADQVLADVGVTLGNGLNVTLPFWTRSPGTIGSTVQAIATYLRVNWRVNSDGTVRMAAEAPATVDPEAVELNRDAARGLVELAPDQAVVLPGVLVGGDSVGDVMYELGDQGLRCRYYTESRAMLRGTLERIVRWITRDTIYLTLYSATVQRQAADGTLDLVVDDLRLQAQGLQSVPIRHGLPGVTVEVATGARVMLGFDSGDPARPYAALWHEGSVTKVHVGGTEAVALASLVSARLDRLQQAFDAHTHLTAGTGSPVTPTPVPNLIPVGTLDSVAAEILETA